MPTSKSSWTKFERDVAKKDWDSTRNPLSGANNRNDDGTPRGGDVIIPKGLSVLIECKYRVRHTHHTLFEEAKADGNFHKKKQTILYTKVKREQGWLVVLDGEFFSQIRQLPGFDDLIKETQSGS